MMAIPNRYYGVETRLVGALFLHQKKRQTLFRFSPGTVVTLDPVSTPHTRIAERES